MSRVYPDVADLAVGDEVLGTVAHGEGGFADHALIGYEVITPEISQPFPLDRVREALAAVESGHATGKIIIEP